MGERVRVVRHDGRLLAAKEPGRDGAEALRVEAELLRRVQVPGVVELVGLRGGATPALLTRWVGPRSLADVAVPMAPGRSAAVVLAVAATVGRLHRAGVVHGDLDATHVLLDPDGRPVLCGFGSAGSIGSSARRAATGPDDEAPAGSTLRPATDVAGLGRLLEHLLGPAGATDGGPRWGRSARTVASQRRALGLVAAQATVPDPAGRRSLGAFTHAVRRAVPDARLVDDPPSPPGATPAVRPTTAPGGRHARAVEPTGRRLPTAVPALAALLAIAATTYFGLSAWWAPAVDRTAVAAPAGSRPSPATTTTSTAAPAASTTTTGSTPAASTTSTVPSAAPVVEHDGRRYEIGAPGDVVRVGRWLCDGRDLAVVLHPDDGTVHLFGAWSTDGGVIGARAVTSVPGATGLDSAGEATGCSDLLVTGGGQVLATLTSEDLR